MRYILLGQRLPGCPLKLQTDMCGELLPILQFQQSLHHRLDSTTTRDSLPSLLRQQLPEPNRRYQELDLLEMHVLFFGEQHEMLV